MPGPSQPHSVWKPLEIPLFRALWIATVVSNVGSAMQDAVSPVFMTRLTKSALIVALVQTAAALPIFLLSLPAGALADVLDRRRLLIATQVWMLVAAGLLGILTFRHVIWPDSAGSAGLLLALTFVLGIGAAMSGPAFLRVLPELLPPAQMPSAMALNSIALNVARALGPALGGLAISVAGPGAAFTLNAVSFAGVAWVLMRWHHDTDRHPTSAEGVVGAMRAGLRYTRYAPRLQVVLVRVGVFICCASAMWSLAAVLATRELALGEVGYCILMAFLGVGAIAGIILMPRVQRRMSTDQLVGWSTAVFAAGVFGLALCRVVPGTCAILFVIGAAWVVILTNFNVATQLAVPGWVKGRAMSMYLLTLWGSWAAGAALWGTMARLSSAHVAMIAAGCGLVLGMVALPRLRLVPEVPIDFSPAFGGPAPLPSGIPPKPEPVHVVIAYRVAPGRIDEFIALVHELRRQRCRNGAREWKLERGEPADGTFTERFTFASPVEFARQRGRITRSEALLETQVMALHDGPDRPSAGAWALSNPV